MARITSRDVAREAGVSQTTVSFVVNGRTDQNIPERTRRHVLSTARRLGYVPSAAARSLALGHSSVVLCVVPPAPVSEALEVFKRKLSAALRESGYTCVYLHLLGEPGELEGVWHSITPAAVVALGRLPAEESDRLNAAQIPLIDDALDPLVDQQQVGYLQVQHLADRGHRIIGFGAIDDPREEAFCAPRLAGARRACRDLDLPEPVVATMHYDRTSARAAMDQWRAASPTRVVTAVAAFNDLIALTVLAECRAQDVAVPEDIAIIGVDDLPVSALATPSLTSIAMDLSIPARRLADAITSAVAPTTPSPEPTAEAIFRTIHRDSS